jgi:DnaJ-class molecular chaperone
MILYERLGVADFAAPADVRRAFRRLVRANHPDANPGAVAARRFAEVTSAYAVLNEGTGSREAYDAGLRAQQQLARSRVSTTTPRRPCDEPAEAAAAAVRHRARHLATSCWRRRARR